MLLFTQNTDIRNMDVASFDHKPEIFVDKCGKVLKSVQQYISPPGNVAYQSYSMDENLKNK